LKRKWNLSDGEKKALRALLPKISDKNFGEFTRLVDNLIIIQLQISLDKDDLLDKPHVSSTYIEQITRSLSCCMERFAASCEPKGGRNKDKRFHVLIIEIANFFKLYLPNSAISKYPNTHFSRDVTYILTDVLDERYSEYKGPEDPERRIEDALKEFHARVN